MGLGVSDLNDRGDLFIECERVKWVGRGWFGEWSWIVL